jgi:hypothetical protein
MTDANDILMRKEHERSLAISHRLSDRTGTPLPLPLPLTVDTETPVNVLINETDTLTGARQGCNGVHCKYRY